MKLTQPQRDLLKRLAEKPTGEIALGVPHHPQGWDRLEDANYITVEPATRGDTSVLIFKITDAGRGALTAAA